MFQLELPLVCFFEEKRCVLGAETGCKGDVFDALEILSEEVYLVLTPVEDGSAEIFIG